MKARELDRTLELADELAELRSRLHRVRHLEAELDRESDIERRMPEIVDSVVRRRSEIEGVARALEQQWVDQEPLVAIWQRAVDLAEQAAYAGADALPYREDADEARRRVEAARLETREHLDRLARERECLVDVALAAPIELPLAGAVRDDSRPEAARREALALVDYARMLEAAAVEAAGHAGGRSPASAARWRSWATRRCWNLGSPRSSRSCPTTSSCPVRRRPPRPCGCSGPGSPRTGRRDPRDPGGAPGTGRGACAGRGGRASRR